MAFFALVGHATAGAVEGRQSGLRYPVVILVEAHDLDDAGERAYAVLSGRGWESLFVRRGRKLDLSGDHSDHTHAAQIDEMIETGSSFLIFDGPVMD